jgi:L-lactate dehydrogenase complex protein LldE
MKAALFVTCLTDTLFPAAGKATVTVLQRLGVEVVFPQAQTCCGQMHINSGYEHQARKLIRHYHHVFDEFEYVVVPSGSCAASLRHHAQAYELSEFLIDVLGIEDVGATYPHRVTYHPACHSLRMLRLQDKPLRLLRQVRGIDLVTLPDAEQCCGFGGTFALKNADTSTAMLTDKMANILGTGAEAVTAVDSSCLMHIGGGLSRLRAGTHAIHLAEILASTA